MVNTKMCLRVILESIFNIFNIRKIKNFQILKIFPKINIKNHFTKSVSNYQT